MGIVPGLQIIDQKCCYDTRNKCKDVTGDYSSFYSNCLPNSPSSALLPLLRSIRLFLIGGAESDPSPPH